MHPASTLAPWLAVGCLLRGRPPDGPPDTEPQARRLTLTVDLTSEASCSRRGVLRQTVQATRVEALHAAKSFHDVQ